jgi:hypothetical protein
MMSNVLRVLFLLFFLPITILFAQEEIPLPEHPRPDFQRSQWLNLNGSWSFCFDKQNAGLEEKWFEGTKEFPLKIHVPFPWGSQLSGVSDSSDIAWYQRGINIPDSWQGQRIFLIVGASDWHTSAWLDGQEIGQSKGGYIPFEFELTSFIKKGKKQTLIIRVDDTKHEFKLFGKQGYGDARGIWQTVYLEARPQLYMDAVHFTPDIDKAQVKVHIMLDKPAPQKSTYELRFKNGIKTSGKIQKGKSDFSATIDVPDMRLWSLEDPYLYWVDAIVTDAEGKRDSVQTYFGMRKISVEKLPGTEYPYIALNGKPVYMQLTLDQAYHPQGFYTYPSDAFMRDEILRSRKIGLNGQRIHVKIDLPRKLYWADRLGVLIMADVPNSWGVPDENMRREAENALRGMIKRDYNHPSIFSWVVFNETWGLFDKDRKYTPETQEWVAGMYRLAKKIDPTRLVEDNSPCNLDHVETDINSWHSYLPGYEWNRVLKEYSDKTFPGSGWNYVQGKKQGMQPNLNSECGNVWGYQGSTGDVDWSWDYHLMLDAFHRYPKICGWLYTEHHDVINEWNGYYKYNRSEKYTGLDVLVPGMTLKDLHTPFYLSLSTELCQRAKPGQEVTIPVTASFMTDEKVGDVLYIKSQLCGWDAFGQYHVVQEEEWQIPFQPWFNGPLEPFLIKMPDKPMLVLFSTILGNNAGAVLQRNFTTFLVKEGPLSRDETDDEQRRIVRFAPDTFSKAEWSQKQWNILEGKKVNGAGSGYFEYTINWPETLSAGKIADVTFLAELSSKPLLGKDAPEEEMDGDYMRGKGTLDPSRNPNAYPMTDDYKNPSIVRIRVNGQAVGSIDLPDDPADHRGILSWYSQKRDRLLREAGTYGYLISTTIPLSAITKAAEEKKIVLRLEVDDVLSGGVAIYGEEFGRYPLDPTLVFVLKK